MTAKKKKHGGKRCSDPTCGHQNPPDAQHCDQCGRRLAAEEQQTPVISSPAPVNVKWWLWAIPFVLAVAVYIPALDGQLVWDDQIVHERQIVAFRSVHDVFFPPRGIPEWARSYYRPMITLTYLLDDSLFGRGEIEDARYGPHFMVVLYHALATLFVWMFARQVLCRQRYREWGALAAGVIFAVHPIHTETVAWLTGRSDTVTAMFLIPSLVCALYWRDRRAIWAMVLAPLLFFCALLSKEVALSGLVLLPLLLLLVPGPARGAKRSALAAWLPSLGFFLLATTVYFWLRLEANADYHPELKDGITQTFARFFQGDETRTILDQLMGGLAFYFQKVVIPPPQCALVTTVPDQLYGVAAVAVSSILLVIGLWMWRRGQPVPLIALLFFGFTLLPSLGIAARPIAEQMVAERALYAPSVGLCLLIGALFAGALTRSVTRWVAAVLTLGVATAYAYGTVDRIQVWHDDVALWTDTTAKLPDDGLPVYSLGMYYKRHNRIDDALAAFRQSLPLYDAKNDREGLWLAHNSIGAMLMNKGHFEQAEAEFRKSLAVRGNYPTPYYNLGIIAGQRAAQARQRDGQPNFELLAKARQRFLTAIDLNPNYVKALYQLALLELNMASAYTEAGDVLQVKAHSSAAAQRVGRLREIDPRGKLTKQAEQKLQKAGLSPTEPDQATSARPAISLPTDMSRTGVGAGAAVYQRGIELLRGELYEQALQAFQESLAASEGENSAEGRCLAHNAAGVALINMGQLEEAQRRLQLAAQANPGNPKPHLNLGVLTLHRWNSQRQKGGQADMNLLAEARQQLLTAVQIDSRYAQALHQLTIAILHTAATHKLAGDMTQARAFWREARGYAAQLMQLDPESDLGQRAARLVRMLDAELEKKP